MRIDRRNGAEKISSVLLCAGRSSRMKEEKALLRISELTVIERILQMIIPMSDQVVIVVGANNQAIQDHLHSSRVNLDKIRLTVNEKAALGMFSSVKRGLSLITGAQPVLLHLIDQPFISRKVYEELIAGYDDENLIFQPCIETAGDIRIGHPVLISPALKQIILTAPDSTNLREIFRNHRRKTVKVSDRQILQNINTKVDFNKALEEFKDGNISI